MPLPDQSQRRSRQKLPQISHGSQGPVALASARGTGPQTWKNPEVRAVIALSGEPALSSEMSDDLGARERLAHLDGNAEARDQQAAAPDTGTLRRRPTRPCVVRVAWAAKLWLRPTVPVSVSALRRTQRSLALGWALQLHARRLRPRPVVGAKINGMAEGLAIRLAVDPAGGV